jgi:hypothetical protein
MRVAILIAGHIRTWNDYAKQKLIDFIGTQHTFDIFLSTHHTRERSEYLKEEVLSESEIISLFSGLPLRDISVDDDTLLPPTDLDVKNHYIWRMWRKVATANDMRKKFVAKHDINHDYVVRYRPDIVVMNSFDFTVLPTLSSEIIIGFGTTLGYPDDMFAIASPEVMDQYCDLYKVYRKGVGTHTIVGVTLKKYPVYKHVQLGIIRTVKAPYLGKITEELKDGLFLDYFRKENFGHK